MLILHTATMLNSSIIFDSFLVNSLGFLYMILWASLVTQTVKNLPAMKETWVRSLGWEIPWRRAWQPTPVFLPGEFHGQRSLAGYNPWGFKESDMTERLSLFSFPA